MYEARESHEIEESILSSTLKACEYIAKIFKKNLIISEYSRNMISYFVA